MALEAHLGPALDVEHDAVAVVAGGRDGFGAGLLRQFEELLPVKPVQPRQVSPDIASVQSAAEM